MQTTMNITVNSCISMRITVVVVLFLFSLNLTAQQGQGYPSSNTLYERTWFATDRDVYIPGDKILVSLATIDGYYQLPVTFSAVAYIELYTKNGTPVIQEKALLHDGKGAVQLNIPKNIETDFYYLRAYTNYQKNFGSKSFIIKKIRLINPFRMISVEKTEDSVMAQNIAYSYQFRNDSLFITCKDSTMFGKITVKSAFDNDYLGLNATQLNDSVFVVALRGMKNVLSVSGVDNKNAMMVSDSAHGISISTNTSGKVIQYTSNGTLGTNSLVVASAFRADQGKFNDTYCMSNGPVVIPTVFPFRPELSSDMLFGKLTIKAGVALPKHVLVSVPRSTTSLRVAKVEPDSSFCLDMSNQYANSSLILTPTDTSSAISIHIQDEFFTGFDSIQPKVYIPEDYLGTYIQSLMVNAQLADAFDSTANPEVDDKNTIYGSCDEKLDLDKFIKLQSLEEYIHELLPSVYVIKKKKRKSIRISDYNARGFVGKTPLLLVDGTPFFNHGTVLYIPPVEIESIWVLNRKLTYLSATFDGVLDIRTRNHYSEELDMAANTLNLDYISPKTYNNHASLFSNTPLWLPCNTILPSGQFTRIERGQLVIRLQGLSDGKPFEVYSEPIK